MNYGFLLLSLLMIFLLVVIYYSSKENFSKGNKIFKSILLTTYIMELSNIALYLEIAETNKSNLYGKIYIMTISLWFALFSLYYLKTWLCQKWIQKESILKKESKMIIICFIVIQIISFLWIAYTPVLIKDNLLYFPANIRLLIKSYLLIELIILLIARKKVKLKDYIHLIVIWIVQLLFFSLQNKSPELPLLNIGILFLTFYTYFTLENADKKEIKKIELERDYALKQTLDKSSFLKNLSHQLRTPLNTIDGFGQVITDSNNIEDIKRDIQDITLASRDLIDVINGMIDLSIIESGKLELINENYNIYDTIEEITQITTSKLRDKKIEFTTDIEENIPEVLLGDSERISQIILNILMTAIKNTEKGKIKLEVASVKSSTLCRLKVTIKDTTAYLKQEDINILYQDNTMKESDYFDLAISKYLVNLMDGLIEVESNTEKGTTIILSIDQKIIKEKQEIKNTKRKKVTPFQANSKRILLVDDNKLNLKVATRLLEPYQVEVTEAGSGQECLSILEHDTNFDLILMDDLMPEMSGTECLDILKKIERVEGYYIPVVVLTANAINGMKEKYLNVGFEDYLSKPIDKYELHRILTKYLKDRK